MDMSVLLNVMPAVPFFLSAARHLSFTKAAADLCVTQGAVSHRIRQLEDGLGFPLFHRFPRKLMLTGEVSWAIRFFLITAGSVSPMVVTFW